MKWNKLTIETTTAAEDMLSYELSEMGMEGVEIEDHVPLSEEDRKIMYVDLLPDEIAPDDGKARISCYVDEKEDLQAVIAKVKAKIEELSAFLPVGSGEITLGVTEEEDWINNWKVFFKPFRLDDNIVIKPTWETLTDKKDDDIVVEIDPVLHLEAVLMRQQSFVFLSLKSISRKIQNSLMLEQEAESFLSLD